MRILIISLVALCTFNSAGAVTADTTQFSLATIILRDGTKISGFIEKEFKDSLVITDFNLGTVTILKEQIKDIEIRPIEGRVVIETSNGVSYTGEVIGLRGNILTLNSPSLGIISIESNTISGIISSGSYATRNGNIWFANPNATRYFFAPSAIPLKKKEGYFQNAYLLANSINVGITNNLTLGGGVVIPLLFYVTPKISFKASGKLYLGGGILFTQSFINDFGLSAGIGYGLATYGTAEHNFTIGAGYGYARFDKKYSTTPMPIVTLNGMSRVAKKVSLLTENWLIPRAGYNKEVPMQDTGGIQLTEMVYEKKEFYSAAVSLGLRFMPGSRTSVDFSVVGIRTDPGKNDMVLPYLDFVYKF